MQGIDHHWLTGLKRKTPTCSTGAAHKMRLGNVSQAGWIAVLRKERWQRCLLIFQWADLGFGKCKALCEEKGLVKHLILYCLSERDIHIFYIYLSLNWRGRLVQVRHSFYWGRVAVRGKKAKAVFIISFAEGKNTLISRAIFHQPKMVLNQSDLADQSTLPHSSDYLRRYQTQLLFHGLQKLEE